MRINSFVMEDVRCFRGRQELAVRPLTFLVGENNTGKSSALGCFQVLMNSIKSQAGDIDFNTHPYNMGCFRDIVSRRRPAVAHFRLGFGLEGGPVQGYSLCFSGTDRDPHPAVTELALKLEHGEIHFHADDRSDPERPRLKIDSKRTNRKKNIFHCATTSRLLSRAPYMLEHIDLLSMEARQVAEGRSARTITAEQVALREFLKENPVSHIGLPNCFSFDPVHSRPRRNHELLAAYEEPDGNKVPMFLMGMKSSSGERWAELQGRLEDFGKRSRLFEKVELKWNGRSTASSFQVQVKAGGPSTSIVDAGQGVNQVLPLLVRLFICKEPHIFLVQQPEVHLHPRAEAELSSLLVEMAKTRGHRFVVETHSDYMVDRARIEIQRGNIAPEDLSLVYMESKGAGVTVHNIGFDEQSNLLNVPGSYGDFFQKEMERLVWNRVD